MKRILTASGAFLLAVGPVFAADDWLPTVPVGTTQVRLETFTTGLGGTVQGVSQQLPTKIVPIPDGSGRLVVSTLGGLMRVVDADGGLLADNSGVYLNTNTAQSANQSFAFGLTSVAFHPDFADSARPGFGKLYALVTEAPKASPADYDFTPVVGSGNNHAAVLVEYTVNPTSIGADFLIPSGANQNVARRELFVAQEPDNEHNFGDLAFDSNGHLYITAGDGLFNFNGGVNNEAQNAQELGSVLGKVLRIDPLGNNSTNGQYGIVADNVFAADNDPNTLGEIFSFGHRNPWRISVDHVTGDVLVGEVGHFNIEEINRVTNGGNFGWPVMEGSFLINQADGFDLTPDTGNAFANANGITPPLFQYDHQDGASATGGFVYRGNAIPELVGKYIFADFAGGDFAGPRLFAGDPTTGLFEQLLIAQGSASLGQPVSFGQDEQGELFIVTSDGRVLTINPAGPAGPPPTVLANGGFDDNGGSLDAWNTFGTNASAQTQAVLDGTHSLKIFGEFNGQENFTGAFQGIAVTEGMEVTADASAFIRSQDTLAGKDNQVFMKIEYYSAFGAAFGSEEFLGEISILIADGSTSEDAWIAHQITGTAPEGAVEVRLSFVFRQLNNNNGAIHIDGVSLTAILLGDLDGDGFVGITDLNIVLGNWNQSVTAGDPLVGDPSGDGFVGIDDLNLVLGGWNNGSPPASRDAAVPEPGTLALASWGIGWVLRRRR